jgi:fatty-acyl-CoA synthase
MLKGLMMEAPLSLIDVLDYGARIHRKAEIVSVTVEGGWPTAWWRWA